MTTSNVAAATAYAVKHLTRPPTILPDEVLLYMERVQATLGPLAASAQASR